VNQSVIDLFASLFALLTAAVEVDGTHMSHYNSYDQFICRVWLTRLPLWGLLVTSTYGILLTALERYVAVVHHIWYKVRRVYRPTPIDCATLPHAKTTIALYTELEAEYDELMTLKAFGYVRCRRQVFECARRHAQ